LLGPEYPLAAKKRAGQRLAGSPSKAYVK
jgi:hypothetical protein